MADATGTESADSDSTATDTGARSPSSTSPSPKDSSDHTKDRSSSRGSSTSEAHRNDSPTEPTSKPDRSRDESSDSPDSDGADSARTETSVSSRSARKRDFGAQREPAEARLSASDTDSPEAASSGSTSAPEGAPAGLPTLGSLLDGARREIERVLFNKPPTIAPVITSQGADGVVTGNLGAHDADGDPLRYTVVGEPSLGRLTIDPVTGDFVYTPVVDFAAYGGDDAFDVAVEDQGTHIHGLQGLLQAPIRFVRGIPFIGSLLSPFLPMTNPTATVRLTFDGAATVTALAFPPGFRWGVSTAGFQSEMGGGAALDVNSDWWQWMHDPLNHLLLGWKAAVPEDGPGEYLEYETDADLAANAVGADTFRFGIEWSRIFPNSTEAVDTSGGFTPEVLAELDALADRRAVEHYREELAAMHAAGLEPLVTINHFTLPIWVHNPAAARLQAIFGATPPSAEGWISPSTVTEFEKYSAYLAWKYGDQVTDWIVLNEPVNSMLTSYYSIPFATGFPPAVFRPDLVAEGLRNEAAGYSAAYDIIHQLDPDAQVGFALNMYAWRGANPANPSDRQAAATFSEFYNKWFPDAVLRGEMDANFDGVITADEVHPELAGKADFFGVNYYSGGTVVSFGGAAPFASMPVLTGYPQFANLINVAIGNGCPTAECTDTAQIVNPAGLREVLDIAASYGIPLWVTENGLADADDSNRASYTVRHLAVINKAIADGMDIRGYTAWSLTDNLEWVLGYAPKYGLYSYDPVTLERTPRPSVVVFNQLFTGNAIPADLFRAYVNDVRNHS
jgi:beta-galactosidase